MQKCTSVFRFFIFFSLLIWLCFSKASAQKNLFTHPDNSWHYSLITPDYSKMENFYWTNSKVVNGKTYRRDNEYSLLFRDDTITGKVYCIKDTISDTFENVLFDYEMSVGDTISYEWVFGHRVVDRLFKIDTIMVDSVPHRRYYFNSLPHLGSRQYNFVEGIGCMSHPLFPLVTEYCFEQSHNLICFYNQNGAPDFIITNYGCWGDPPTLNCSRIDVKSTITSATQIIYPNPTSSLLSIDCSTFAHLPTYISISSVDGLTKEYFTVQPQTMIQTIDVSQLPNGIYVLSINTSNTAPIFHKVVVNH